MWRDGEVGRWGDGDPPLTPPPPRRGMWGVWEDGDLEKDLAMAHRLEHFFIRIISCPLV
ncbi:MAG: hypothetical protein F6K48_19920 [Okeania sp. SIO3H1]|nr:hypothetical protein [Okeania sp. SIO3H1]